MDDDFEKEDYNAYVETLNHVKTTLQSYIMDAQDEDNKNNPISKEIAPKLKVSMSNKVFIVHGHDDAVKAEVARFVENLGLEAIILHEQVDGGKTIIEKIEAYTNVGFGIVLYTPCDVGGKDESSLSKRARQNVVFEHGYLMAKLGRNHVCALVKDSVEFPSDISGVIYKSLDKDGAWKYAVAKEMKSVNFDIDMNKI